MVNLVHVLEEGFRLSVISRKQTRHKEENVVTTNSQLTVHGKNGPTTRRTTVMLVAILLSAAATRTARADTWEIDSVHSYIGFSVRHMMIANVRGRFAKMKGRLEYDGVDPTKARIEVTVDTASVDTGDPKRDEHLRSPDFFDVAAHPAMVFKSTKIISGPKGLTIMGTLALHGVARPAVFQASTPSSPISNPGSKETRFGVSATTSINRKDFGMGWNAALDHGGVAVGDTVAVTVDVEFVRAGDDRPPQTAKK